MTVGNLLPKNTGMASPTLRLMNRQGGWEVLGGFAGGPLLLIFLGWMWLSGSGSELSGWKWLMLLLGTIASPFLVAYWAYHALAVATLWIEFTPHGVRVRKLLGVTSYSADKVSGLRFDNQPISMHSSDTGLRIPVGEARFVSVHGSGGKTLGRVRVSASDRSRLVRFVQDHGGRQWLPA